MIYRQTFFVSSVFLHSWFHEKHKTKRNKRKKSLEHKLWNLHNVKELKKKGRRGSTNQVVKIYIPTITI